MATNATTNTATKYQAGSNKHIYAMSRFLTSRAGSDYLVCTWGIKSRVYFIYITRVSPI